jgi:hypothetical protein
VGGVGDAMIEKPKHIPTYTPERIKELVDRMATLRFRWLASVKSRTPSSTEKAPGGLSSRLAKVKDWPKNYRG